MTSLRSLAIALVLFASMGLGCTAAVEPGSAEGELREPRICPAIAILCAPGYEARSLPNCRWSCVPERGAECRTDDECTIYCITAPCPVGVCERGRCTVDEEPSACAAILCLEGTVCEERGGSARCVPVADPCGEGMSWNDATATCECTTIGLCAEGWSWDPAACECVSPCATVRCAAGTHCVAEGGSASCVADEPVASCVRTGCSGQICADTDVITTCEWREEYACYADATCERQADGRCGFTATPELDACLGGI